MFHLDASKSFCFFALNIPSYPKHAGTIMSSLATILKELLLQGASKRNVTTLFVSAVKFWVGLAQLPDSTK
jgi:hypothetical protein